MQGCQPMFGHGTNPVATSDFYVTWCHSNLTVNKCPTWALHGQPFKETLSRRCNSWEGFKENRELFDSYCMRTRVRGIRNSHKVRQQSCHLASKGLWVSWILKFYLSTGHEYPAKNPCVKDKGSDVSSRQVAGVLAPRGHRDWCWQWTGIEIEPFLIASTIKIAYWNPAPGHGGRKALL